METYIILLTALLPVAILVYYIYHKDKKSPEPIGQLVKAFLLGVISLPLSLCISIPLGFIGIYPAEATNIWGSISSAFFGAAIPEEIAKFFMLWLVLRKNPYFDEKMDGIVYAVCVSLGFAALENIVYLFSYAEAYLSVGISRAIFAIPGHFCFGVLMGYYYSLAKFYPKAPRKNKVLILIAPIIVHGLYDTILFIINVTPAISGNLMILFLIFCHKMWKYGSENIAEHLRRDNTI
ncbi:MAG: PrsW family intramembrane metalloprotease [Bacteroidaceae bacterium]|nr:PrsW family intramembrane metalloprotease [Bacteroidaceae bacterium]